MAGMTQHIIELLGHGPQVSAGLYSQLNALGYPRSASKTRVSQLVKSKRLFRYSLNLGRGASIVALEESHHDPRLLRHLVDNQFYGRPALVNVVDCLRTSHQNLTRSDVAALASLEIGDASAAQPDWIEVDNVIRGLEELGILIADQNDGGVASWSLNKSLFIDAKFPVGHMNLSSALVKMRRRVKYTLTLTVAEWLQKNGFASDGGTKTAEPVRPANYLSLPFDVVGFSFLAGIASRAKDAVKPRPLLGDCLVEECNVAYAKSFCKRLDECSIKGKVVPLAFVLARSFEFSAFTFLRTRGIAHWTRSQLLGTQTATAIDRVLEIAEALVSKQNVDPTAFAEMFGGLDSYSGLLGNLKGKLFEMMMGYFFQSRAQSARLGWEISDGEQSYDVDVFASQNSVAWAIECKGIKEGSIVPDDEVTRHFKQRVPLARSQAVSDKHSTIRSIIGLVVTSGTFEAATMEKIREDAFGSRTDTSFQLWDRARLIKELTDNELHQIAAIVKRYY